MISKNKKWATFIKRYKECQPKFWSTTSRGARSITINFATEQRNNWKNRHTYWAIAPRNGKTYGRQGLSSFLTLLWPFWLCFHDGSGARLLSSNWVTFEYNKLYCYLCASSYVIRRTNTYFKSYVSCFLSRVGCWKYVATILSIWRKRKNYGILWTCIRCKNARSVLSPKWSKFTFFVLFFTWRYRWLYSTMLYYVKRNA